MAGSIGNTPLNNSRIFSRSQDRSQNRPNSQVEARHLDDLISDLEERQEGTLDPNNTEDSRMSHLLAIFPLNNQSSRFLYCLQENSNIRINDLQRLSRQGRLTIKDVITAYNRAHSGDLRPLIAGLYLYRSSIPTPPPRANTIPTPPTNLDEKLDLISSTLELIRQRRGESTPTIDPNNNDDAIIQHLEALFSDPRFLARYAFTLTSNARLDEPRLTTLINRQELTVRLLITMYNQTNPTLGGLFYGLDHLRYRISAELNAQDREVNRTPFNLTPQPEQTGSNSQMTRAQALRQLNDICDSKINRQPQINRLYEDISQYTREIHEHLDATGQSERYIKDLVSEKKIPLPISEEVITDPITQDFFQLPVLCFCENGEQVTNDAHSLRSWIESSGLTTDPSTREKITAIYPDTRLVRTIHSILQNLLSALRSETSTTPSIQEDTQPVPTAESATPAPTEESVPLTNIRLNMSDHQKLAQAITLAMSKGESREAAWKNFSLKTKLIATFNTKDKARVLGQRLVELGAITQVQFDTIINIDKPNTILSGKLFHCYTMQSDNPDLSKLNEAITLIGQEQN